MRVKLTVSKDVANLSPRQAKYRKFFKKTMDKHGVKDIKTSNPSEKKKLFDDIERNWKEKAAVGTAGKILRNLTVGNRVPGQALFAAAGLKMDLNPKAVEKLAVAALASVRAFYRANAPANETLHQKSVASVQKRLKLASADYVNWFALQHYERAGGKWINR